MSHARRPVLRARHPVHLTFRWCAGLPPLREGRAAEVLLSAFRATNEQGGMRVVAYSIQRDHLHLIGESDDRMTLARRVQGMKVRMARRLNKVWQRRGTVFADRYHRVDLTSPRQVRNALRYVLQNDVRHGGPRRGTRAGRPDHYSSGRWFDGWREERLARRGAEALARGGPVVAPRTWLLGVGWRRWHGAISVEETPAARAVVLVT